MKPIAAMAANVEAVVRRRMRGRIPAAWRLIAAFWIGSRLLVMGAAVAAQLSRGRWQAAALVHPLSLLGSWDGRWYRAVAERGYLLIPGRFSDPAFFPLLPILERAVGVVGVPPVASGIVLANVGFLAGLIAFYALGCELLPEADSRRAAIYLAIFPFGFVFSMAYPEGAVLPFVALTGVFALRDRWLAAAASVALATLARPEGIALAVPLFVIAFRRWPALTLAQRAESVAAVLAGPAALASFSAHLWWAVGNPLAWSEAERAWGRSFSPVGIFRAFAALPTAVHYHNAWLYRDAGFCVIYIALLVVALRAQIPGSWVAAGAVMVLMPLGSGSFTSDARFGLLALPIFWGLAVLGRRRILNLVIVAVSPVLLAAAVFTIPARFP